MLGAFTTSDWIGFTGALLSALGFAIAIVQTYRAWSANATLENEKRTRNATIWHNIALVLNAYETIEDARSALNNGADTTDTAVIAAKLSSARRCIVDHYLELLKSAVLDEPEFNEGTVRLWIEQGRLENDWRVKQARKFIRSGQATVPIVLTEATTRVTSAAAKKLRRP